MCRFLKQVMYVLLIILLLPYVVTVFLNGRDVLAVDKGENPYITVERDGEEKKLTLKEYGIGVLAKEMKADMRMETLKAQAVLIRTSIYRIIQDEGSSTVMKKEYWSRAQMENYWGLEHYSENYRKMEEAWSSTDGKVILYNGELALTPYHRLSNGKTRSGEEVFGTGEYPYLQMRDCPKDVEAKEQMTSSMIQETGFEILAEDSAGYVTKVKCGEEEITGEAFRSTYHLPSASFQFQDFEGKTRIISQGIGHGIGMSQYTAENMAKEGKTYEEILQYFFEGTEMEEVAEILVDPE